MSDDINVQSADALTTGQPASGDNGGQAAAAASADINGEAGKNGNASPKGEPSGEGLFDGMTPEQLYESKKALQREFGKRSERLKELETQFQPYGGVDAIKQMAEYLTKNPRFNQWLEQEKQMQTLGLDKPEDMDEETRKSMDVVKRIAAAEIQQAMKEKVEPLAEVYKQNILKENFSEMDKRYGPEWRDMQEHMAELAQHLPESVQDNPKLSDLEDLYWKAIRTSGKMEDVMARAYEKRLAHKKSQSVEKPPSAVSPGAPLKISNMQEAFAAARSRMGG